MRESGEREGGRERRREREGERGGRERGGRERGREGGKNRERERWGGGGRGEVERDYCQGRKGYHVFSTVFLLTPGHKKTDLSECIL